LHVRAAAEVEERGKGPKSSSGVGSGIRLEDVAVTFKNHQVLKNASWEVKRGERVGLVGINGAGKTTQLKVITGSLIPDSGEVLRAKQSMRIAYLTQEFDVEPSRTVREEFMSAFEDQLEVLRRQEAVQKGLEECGDDMDKMGQLLDELNELSKNAVDLDVNLLDKKIDQMMPELGFSLEDNDRLVASYSGGWQMRMCLGKILLQEPDLLLLDEPTNHLDIDAIGWLENYLKDQEVPMVIVSHDRQFLDALCTKIVETEQGITDTFKGNYSDYVRQKKDKVAQQWTAWEKQQKELERQKEIARRLAAGANSGRASTAEKTIEKLKAEGTFIEKPFVAKKRTFTFPSAERMGQSAIKIQNLTHGYHDSILFEDANLEIERGERVAIIGPNGAGKSTLLRLIMGQEKPLEGEVSLGPHGIVPNYFEQNQAEALDLKKNAIETLQHASPDAKLNDIKALLGKMMFNGAAMEKPVSVLSGGEKARLAMAKFMLTDGTLLILDEPTNHLDIPTKETLEEAVEAFDGAVIAVSHDRYFLKRIATRVVTIEDRKLNDFDGDYDVFLSQNAAEKKKVAKMQERAREAAKSGIKSKSKMSKAEKAALKKDKAKSFNETNAGKRAAKSGKKYK
jgi:ATPase subunit of ABC transporter with duplicated ATPase domains